MYAVAVARPGDTKELLKQKKSPSLFIVESETDDFSSTKVRKMMLAGEYNKLPEFLK